MRKPLTPKDAPLVVRTDYSNDSAWRSLWSEVSKPWFPFPDEESVPLESLPYEDPTFDGITPTELLKLATEYDYRFIFIADRKSMLDPEHTLVVLSLNERSRGRSFRALPSEIVMIEANLAESNIDFEDFEGHCDSNGVLRSQ